VAFVTSRSVESSTPHPRWQRNRLAAGLLISLSALSVQATRSCSSTCRCSTSSCPSRASTCARSRTTSTPRSSWAPCRMYRTQQSGSSIRECQLCLLHCSTCNAVPHEQLSCLVSSHHMFDIAGVQMPCSYGCLPYSALSDHHDACRYLNIRMLRNPTLYGVPLGQIDADPLLKVCARLNNALLHPGKNSRHRHCALSADFGSVMSACWRQYLSVLCFRRRRTT
jgi:hypothetical protein